MIDYSNIFVDFPEYSYFKDLAGHEKIQYLNSIPFSFNPDKPLFSKQNKPKKISLILHEMSLAFNLRQIEEGGFFVIFGKKAKI